MGSGEAKKFRAMYGSAGRHGESFWSEETPAEECGGADRDCDGFIDEGLQCANVSN